MTPSARISAAIDLLDRILSGELADRALAGWGRKNRYAGSKDRAAIADLVYEVLRRRRSLGALGGGDTGRALLLGYLRDTGQDPDAVFGAGTYAPAALTQAERALGRPPEPDTAESADFPDWIWPDISASLGADAQNVAEKMRSRAAIHLRVNLMRLSRSAAIAELSEQGIAALPHPLSDSAVEVVEGARKIRNAPAYLEGRVELQDASSQAVADMVPLSRGDHMLDFCAGGGGKTLAVAGRVMGEFYAHDVDKGRMKDLPARAARAGVSVHPVSLAEAQEQALYQTVLLDAPCSGSGSWRRDPQGKWLLTREKLSETIRLQHEILKQTASLVAKKGHLVYATCSLLACENTHQVSDFLLHHKEFSLEVEKRFTPLDGGDGFYCAVMVRST